MCAVSLDGVAFSWAWFDLIFYRNVLYRFGAQEQEPVPDRPGVGEAVPSGFDGYTRRNPLTTHFSGCVPVPKQRVMVQVPEQCGVPIGAPRKHPDDPSTSLRLRESQNSGLGKPEHSWYDVLQGRDTDHIRKGTWARPGGAWHQLGVSRESGRLVGQHCQVLPARHARLALGQGVPGLRRICLERPCEALGNSDCSPTPR